MSGRPIFPEDYAYRTLRILHITDCHLLGDPHKQFAGISPNQQFEQVLIHAKRHFEVLATKDERQLSASFTWRVSPNSNFATAQQSSLATPVLNIGARTNPEDIQGAMVPPFAKPDTPISLGAEEQIFANRGVVPDWLDTTPAPDQVHVIDPDSYQVEGISLARTKLPSPEELSNASSLNLENALNNLSATYPEFAQTLHQISSLHPRVKLLDATREDAEVAEIGGETDLNAIPSMLAAHTRAARIACNTQPPHVAPAEPTASRQERVLDMIICTGDIMHNTNETPEEKRAAYNLFVQLVQTHFPGIPVFITPGNHDELEYFDQLAQVPDFYVNTHTVDSFNINSHWDLCMLQSKDGDEVAGDINGMHAQLLAQQAGQSVANNKNIFIATHHNLIPTESAWLDQYQLKGREDFLNRLVTIPAIKFLLHGHIHQEQSYSLAMRSVRQHCYTDLFSDSRNFIAHQILIARALGSKELGDLSQRAHDAATGTTESTTQTTTATTSAIDVATQENPSPPTTPASAIPNVLVGTNQELASTSTTLPIPDVSALAASIKSMLAQPAQQQNTSESDTATSTSTASAPEATAPSAVATETQTNSIHSSSPKVANLELAGTITPVRKTPGLASDTLPQHPKAINNPLAQALRQANQVDNTTPANTGGVTRVPSVAISNNVEQLVNGNSNSRQIVTVKTAALAPRASNTTPVHTSTSHGEVTAYGTTSASSVQDTATTAPQPVPNTTTQFAPMNLAAAETSFAIKGESTQGKTPYRQYFRASATPYRKPTVESILATRPAPYVTTDYYPPASWNGVALVPTYADLLRNSSDRLLVLHQGRDPKSGTLIFHTLEEQHILPLNYAVVQVCPGYNGLFEMIDLERYPEAREQREWFEVIKARANLHSLHAHRHPSGLPLYFPLQGSHALDTARQELVQRLEAQVTLGDTNEPNPDYAEAGLLSLHKPDLLTRINELLENCKVVADSNGELSTITCQANLSVTAPESKYQQLLEQCRDYLQPHERPRATPAQSAQYVADIGLDQLVTRLTLLLQLEGLTRQLLEKDLFHSQKTSSLGISSIRPTLDSKELCRFALQVLTQLTGNGLSLNYRSFAHYELQAFMARQQLSAAIIEDLQRPESREGTKADAWHVYSQINPFVLNWSAEQVWICNRPEVMRGKDGNDFTVTHMPTASFDASEQERRAYDLTTYLFQPEQRLTGDMLELYARTRLNYQHAAQRLTSYSQIEGLHRQLLSLNYYCVNKNNNSFDNSYVGRCTMGLYQGLTFSRVYLQLLKDLAGFVDTGFSHLLNYFTQVQNCPTAYQQQVVAQLHELKAYLESLPPSHSPALETLRTLFSSIPSVEITPRTSGSILTAQAEAELMRDYTAAQPVDNSRLVGTLHNPFPTPTELRSEALVTSAQGKAHAPTSAIAAPRVDGQGSPLVATSRATNTDSIAATASGSNNAPATAPQLVHLQQIVNCSAQASAQRDELRFYPASEVAQQLAPRALQDAQLVSVANYYRMLEAPQREAELCQLSESAQVTLRATLAYLGVQGVLTPSNHLARQITPSLTQTVVTPVYQHFGWWAEAVSNTRLSVRAQYFAHHLNYHPYSLRYPVIASHATRELEQLIRLANLHSLFLSDRERTALHELQACLHRRRFYGFNGGTKLILGRKCYWLGFNLHMALAPIRLGDKASYMPHVAQRTWVGARYLQENPILRAYAQSNHAILALQTQPTLAATYGQQLGHLGYRYLTDIAACFTQPLQVFQGIDGYYLPTSVSRDISIRTLRAAITDAHNTPSQRLLRFISTQLQLRAQAAQDIARGLTGRELSVDTSGKTSSFPTYVVDFAERLRGFKRLLAQHRGTIADAEELATQASRLAAQNYISIQYLLDQVEAYLEQQHRAYQQAVHQATQEQTQESLELIPAPERLDMQALPYLVQRIDLLAHTNRANLQNFVDELIIGENNQISERCLFSDSANFIQETLTYGAIQVANREMDYILNATNLNNGYLRRVFKGPYKGLNWLFLADPGKLGELIYRLDQHNLALDVPDNYENTTVRLSEPHQARSNLSAGVSSNLISDSKGQRNRSYFNTLGIAPIGTIAPNVDSMAELRNQMQFVHLNYDYLQNRWLKYQASPVGLSAPYYQATSNSFTLHRFNLAYARKPVLDDIYRFCMTASWDEIEELLPQLELPLMMDLAYAIWNENRALLTQARDNPSLVTTTRLRSGFTAPHDQHLLGADLLPEVETRRGWLAVGAVFIPAPVLNLERYWRVLFNIQIHSTPSTSVQFKPKCNDFTIDQIPPGYRVISLFADGNYNTKVIRLSKKELKMPEKIAGY